MASTIPFINGVQYNKSNIIITAFGPNPMTNVLKIDFSEENDAQPQHAIGSRDPVGLQEGNTTYKGSLRMLKEDVISLNKASPSPSGSLYDIPFHNYVITYLKVGANVISKVTLQNCRIISQKEVIDENTKAIAVDMDLFVSKILYK